MPAVALVYAGPGASEPCIAFATSGLLAETDLKVIRCSAEQIIAGDWKGAGAAVRSEPLDKQKYLNIVLCGFFVL